MSLVRLIGRPNARPFNPAPCPAAHSGVVRGVATDTLNQLTVSCGSDWLLKFWRFKTRKQEVVLKLSAAPASLRLHRDRLDRN